jgi:hypothetical protein
MKRFVSFVFLAMLVIGSCAAQSANNDAQRIVGTWSFINDNTNGSDPTITVWVFNANGTGTYTSKYGNENFYWGISATGDISTTKWGDFKIFISSDGRKMIIANYAYQKN